MVCIKLTFCLEAGTADIFGDIVVIAVEGSSAATMTPSATPHHLPTLTVIWNTPCVFRSKTHRIRLHIRGKSGKRLKNGVKKEQDYKLIH